MWSHFSAGAGRHHCYSLFSSLGTRGSGGSRSRAGIRHHILQVSARETPRSDGSSFCYSLLVKVLALPFTKIPSLARAVETRNRSPTIMPPLPASRSILRKLRWTGLKTHEDVVMVMIIWCCQAFRTFSRRCFQR